MTLRPAWASAESWEVDLSLPIGLSDDADDFGLITMLSAES